MAADYDKIVNHIGECVMFQELLLGARNCASCHLLVFFSSTLLVTFNDTLAQTSLFG